LTHNTHFPKRVLTKSGPFFRNLISNKSEKLQESIRPRQRYFSSQLHALLQDIRYLGALGKAMNVEFIYTVLTQTDEAVNLTKIQELIAAGAEGIILTLDMGTPTILNECASANVPFIPLDSTYFSKHDGIDAIFCFADGYTFVYPTMVSSGINGRIKLFCAGYGEGSDQNFGSKGNGTFQQEAVSAIEAVIYPVVLLVNKLNGVSFPDQPAEAERRSCFSMIINSDEDMDAFVNHSFYITGKMENALYSPEQVVSMTAVANPNATYADLVSTLSRMTMDNIRK